MSKILVWDLPARVFHVLFGAGLITAFVIAQFAGEHSRLFPYHMVLGIVLGIMLVLRVVWGFVGTKYSRFGSLLFGPKALLQYLKSALTSRGQHYTAHNPGSSYAILAMLSLDWCGRHNRAADVHWQRSRGRVARTGSLRPHGRGRGTRPRRAVAHNPSAREYLTQHDHRLSRR